MHLCDQLYPHMDKALLMSFDEEDTEEFNTRTLLSDTSFDDAIENDLRVMLGEYMYDINILFEIFLIY